MYRRVHKNSLNSLPGSLARLTNLIELTLYNNLLVGLEIRIPDNAMLQVCQIQGVYESQVEETNCLALCPDICCSSAFRYPQCAKSASVNLPPALTSASNSVPSSTSVAMATASVSVATLQTSALSVPASPTTVSYSSFRAENSLETTLQSRDSSTSMIGAVVMETVRVEAENGTNDASAMFLYIAIGVVAVCFFVLAILLCALKKRRSNKVEIGQMFDADSFSSARVSTQSELRQSSLDIAPMQEISTINNDNDKKKNKSSEYAAVNVQPNQYDSIVLANKNHADGYGFGNIEAQID